jgi:hypothetical protein
LLDTNHRLYLLLRAVVRSLIPKGDTKARRGILLDGTFVEVNDPLYETALAALGARGRLLKS